MSLKDWEKQLLLRFCCEPGKIEGPNKETFSLWDMNDCDYCKLMSALENILEVAESTDASRFRSKLQNQQANALDTTTFGIAIALIKMFVQVNYFGTNLQLDPASQDYLEKLEEFVHDPAFVLDGEELEANIHYPVLIYIAKMLFDELDPGCIISTAWWKLRVNFIHQKCLEEKSSQIWETLRTLEANISRVVSEDIEIQALLKLEMAEIYLYYYDVTSARSLVTSCSTTLGMSVDLGGALGRRTKFQQFDLPQLIVEIELNEKDSLPDPIINQLTIDLTPNVPLRDDTRLEKVKFKEEKSFPLLTSMQQLALLCDFLTRKRTHPNDDVAESEAKAFVDALLLNNPKVWIVHYVTLFQRSLLERYHSRSVERSLQQLEVLKSEKENGKNCKDKFILFFGAHCPLRYQLDTALADVYKSLGSVNSALEVYLRLSLWEEAIECYHVLQLRHKAEEIIRQQLEKQETSKLWCLLGDATDYVEYYEKAWEMSKHRSARVQRQWGLLYYKQKKYEEAAKHFQLSVELNPLEYPVWMRLAFCAMEIMDWALCAKAYRHACTLDSDNFESWNNLGNAYLKLGDKPRALKVLLEATKCDFNVWQVWDNILVVSTDCRAFDESIKAYGRLLDLKENKHVDPEVLGVITRHICENQSDANGASCLKYLKPMLKLFGRLTASVTTNGKLWKLYSDLLVTSENLETAENQIDVMHRGVDYAQKSVRCLTQDPNWAKTLDSCNLTLEYALNLLKRTSEYLSNYPDSPSGSGFKSVAQFTVRKVVSTIERERIVDSTTKLGYEDRLDELKATLTTF